MVLQRRFWGIIHKIKNKSGTWVTDDKEIGEKAVRYFGDLFSADPTPKCQLLHVIPNFSADIDNNLLEAIPSMDEVKR